MKVVRGKVTGIKYIISILPVVLLMTVILYLTVRNAIITLSEEQLSLISKSYSYNISMFANKILSELNIYRDIAEAEGTFNEHTFDLLRESRDVNKAYPYGVYWGDANGRFFHASEWDPDEDFVPYERTWYAEGLRHSDFAFGEPYTDVMTGKTCVSASVKTNLDGVEGVMAADVYLDNASMILSDARIQNIHDAFFVSRKDRVVIASADPAQAGRTVGDINPDELYKGIDNLLADEFVGQTVVKGGAAYYVNISAIENSDWTLVITINRDILLLRLHITETILMTLSIVVFIALAIMTVRNSRRMNETFRRAKADPLTRLYNRTSFKTFCSQTIAANPEQGLMLMFDMDNFKQVNDTFGHPEGDEVLRKFADLLRSFFNRAEELTARLGGDEFAVFVGKTLTRDEISSMLGRFIQQFHEQFDEKYSGIGLSVSIGASYTADSSSNYSDLYNNADSALYKAKQSGKNRFHIQ